MNIASNQAVLLGSDRLSSATPVKCLFHSGGMYVKYFGSDGEYQTYTGFFMQVKNVIASLNEAVESGKITREHYEERLKKDWLNGAVTELLSRYGANNISVDIRSAIDDVTRNLGLPPLVDEWPPLVFEEVLPQVDYLHIRFD